MKRAYIGLGANLGDPPAQLRSALAQLAQHGALVAVSPFYRSAPLGPAGQPDYCNAVCALDTALTPEALLAALLAIERGMGRVRGERWGPRLIDLDLLHVDGERRDTPGLKLPHPQLAARSFVLVPLADIAPMLRIEQVGPLDQAIARVGRDGLAHWPQRG